MQVSSIAAISWSRKALAPAKVIIGRSKTVVVSKQSSWPISSFIADSAVLVRQKILVILAMLLLLLPTWELTGSLRPKTPS